MAKGRKLIAVRNERLLYSQHGDGAGNTSPELREDEIWSMAGGEWGAPASSDGGESVGSTRPSPRSDRRRVGGLSLAFEDGDACDDSSAPRIVHQFRGPESASESPRGRYVATSAPVDVPDWSRIYRVDSVESLHDSDDGFQEEPERVPPHEYLARGRRIAASSVFEGVGRTLKGRDLSRVRDAVWSRTGFYG